MNDIDAARAELTAAGADVSEPFHRDGAKPIPGPDPERRSYLSYASFRSIQDQDDRRLRRRYQPEAVPRGVCTVILTG